MDIWQQTLAQISNKLEPPVFERWFGPTKLLEDKGSSLVVGVPDSFYREWLLDRFLPVIQDALRETDRPDVQLEFVPAPETNEPREAPHQREIGASKAPAGRSPLNGLYTFDAFVVGASNHFAHAASLAVAESPAKAYNPLCIYGGVGMGKTHLMQAIGNHVAIAYPDLKVLYISSEDFTNQLITAIQHRTTIRFREKFRNVDLLLVDDIHFIGGKESTQEEFFHTFNALYDAHKQIVISSDQPPREIPQLEERLVSRFAWGLVTDIQPPDLETRIAILRKKAEQEAVPVPSNMVMFLAEHVKTNIRELEGALVRVIAFASLTGQTLSTELAQDVLKDMLREQEHRITISLIQQRVVDHYQIALADMKSRRRSKHIALPRQVAMYLARELTPHSTPEIGAEFGGKDHSTVLHACGKIRREIEQDAKFRNTVERLKSEICR